MAMRMGAGARVHPVAVVLAAAQVLLGGGARLGPIQRGGRGMTRSRVISLPQHGHLGLAGCSGGGLGAGRVARGSPLWVPRIWCRRANFCFAAGLRNP